MLDFMRRHARSTFIKVILWIIVAVFVLWGVGTFTGPDHGVMARVNGETITPQEVRRMSLRLEEFYRQLYGDNLTPELAENLDFEGRALDQMVNRALLRQEAERLGITVEDEEVRDAIQSIEGLSVDGRFRRDVYFRFVRSQGMTPGAFENLQRQDLMVQKLQDLITRSIRVDESTAREIYRHRNESVSLAFVKVPAAKFQADVMLTDQEIAEYYETHRESFREPARTSIDVLVYSPETFRDRVPVRDEEIREEYEFFKDRRYTQPEQVRARHILIRVPPGASEEEREELRARAEQTLERVQAGEPFAEVARDVSDDEATRDEGGDLGTFRRGQMEEAFEEAAFALEAGERSDIVETRHGFHIIRTEERIPAGTRPLEEVRDDIIDRLRKERAASIAQEAAYDDAQRTLAGQSFEEVARERDIEIRTPPPFAQEESVAGLPRAPRLVQSAFSYEPGEVGPVVSAEDTHFLFRVKERTPSHVPPLEEVRSRVESALRRDRAAELAREKAEEIHERLAAGASLEDVAAEEGLTADTTGAFRRGGDYVPKIGTIPGLKSVAFGLTEEQPLTPEVYTTQRDSFVVLFEESFPVNMSEFEDEKETVIDRLTEQQRQIAMEEFLRALRQQAKIQVNPHAGRAPSRPPAQPRGVPGGLF